MTVETLRRVCDEGCCMSFRDSELDPWDWAYAHGQTSINFVRPMFEVEPDSGGRAYFYYAGDDEKLARESGEEPVYL